MLPDSLIILTVFTQDFGTLPREKHCVHTWSNSTTIKLKQIPPLYNWVFIFIIVWVPYLSPPDWVFGNNPWLLIKIQRNEEDIF